MLQQQDGVIEIPESLPAKLPWYALHVRSRFEKAVAAALQGRGVEEFLPVYKARRRWTDRIQTVTFPLFPGYVFCRLEIGRRLPVLTIPGVISVVGTGKVPAPLPDHEIEAIQAVASAGVPAVPWPYLKEGQKVRIVRDALKDVEGILIKVKNDFRLILSVTILQRAVAIEVDRDSIEPVSASTFGRRSGR